MKISKLIVGLLFAVIACSSPTRETPKGHKFKVLREGDGKLGKPGEFLQASMVFTDSKDSVWNDTRKQDMPWLFGIQEEAAKASEDGITEVLRMCSKGDSVEFVTSAKNFFEKTVGQPIPPGVAEDEQFTFRIGVQDILTQEQASEMGNRLQSERMAKQMSIDSAAIADYLEANGIQAETTASGLRYVVKQQGKGPLAQAGQTVEINYAGRLLDGTYFDTSIESVAKENGAYQEGRPYEPYALVAGQGSVIPGWEEAILLMNKGMKMTVYIPSYLGYGPQRRSNVITENSILVFDMEMVNIQ